MQQRFPDITFVDEKEADDILMIFSVGDIPRGCILPSWNWTLALDAMLPTQEAPGGATFAAIVEVKGMTKVRGDLVSEVIERFAALRNGKLLPPASAVRCAYGLDPSD